jgi:hypothetical protein
MEECISGCVEITSASLTKAKTKFKLRVNFGGFSGSYIVDFGCSLSQVRDTHPSVPDWAAELLTSSATTSLSEGDTSVSEDRAPSSFRASFVSVGALSLDTAMSFSAGLWSSLGMALRLQSRSLKGDRPQRDERTVALPPSSDQKNV